MRRPRTGKPKIMVGTGSFDADNDDWRPSASSRSHSNSSQLASLLSGPGHGKSPRTRSGGKNRSRNLHNTSDTAIELLDSDDDEAASLDSPIKKGQMGEVSVCEGEA